MNSLFRLGERETITERKKVHFMAINAFLRFLVLCYLKADLKSMR